MKLLKILSKLFFFAFLFPIQLVLAATNLNTATQSEIEALPGVGPKVAKDIMAARPFKSVSDLKNVKGIGNAKFKKLEPMVSVGADSSTTPAAPSQPAAKAPEKSVAPVEKAANGEAHAQGGKKELAQGEMININTASKQDLQRLPGIGDKKADAIIQARPFKTTEDLMKVKGIKQGIFNKIKDHVTAG